MMYNTLKNTKERKGFVKKGAVGKAMCFVLIVSVLLCISGCGVKKKGDSTKGYSTFNGNIGGFNIHFQDGFKGID